MTSEIPSCYEIEESILSLILNDTEKAFEAISDHQISEELFFHPANQFLFKYFQWRKERKFPMDITLIFSHLQSKGRIEEIGGPSRLVELSTLGAYIGTASHYFEVLKNTAAQRELYLLGIDLKNNASKENADDLIGKALIATQKAQVLTTQEEEEQTTSQAVDEFIENLARLKENPEQSYGVLSGCKVIDEETLGFHKKETTFISAKPSLGKTTLMLQWALSALEQRESVLIFSLEMPKQKLLRRLTASHAGIDLKDLKKPYNLTKEELNRLKETAQFLKDAPLTIDDRKQLSFSQVSAKVKKMSKQGKARIVMIDFLQRSGPEKWQLKDKRHEQLEYFSRNSADMSGEYDCSVVMASQLNEKNETKGSTAPQEDGDVMFRIQFKVVNEKPVPCSIIFDKNRDGERGLRFGVYLDGPRQRFNCGERITD